MAICLAENPGPNDCAIYSDWERYVDLSEPFFGATFALESILEVRPAQDPYDEQELNSEINRSADQADTLAAQICEHACAVCPFVPANHLSIK